jgi:hypothetical protein
MKTSTLFFAVLLIAAGAFAQEATPDYSRTTLLHVLAAPPVDDDAPPVRFGGGAVSFAALGTRWAFLYRPMLPLAGSRPVVSQVWPDAFSLTGTELATLPRHFRDYRETNEELMRIERMDRGRVRVTVRPGSQ